MTYDKTDRRLTWVRHLSKCHDLIQQNSEGPNVRFDTELVVVDGLRSGPLHRKLSSFFCLINIFILFLETKHTNQCSLLTLQRGRSSVWWGWRQWMLARKEIWWDNCDLSGFHLVITRHTHNLDGLMFFVACLHIFIQFVLRCICVCVCVCGCVLTQLPMWEPIFSHLSFTPRKWGHF